MTFTRAGARVTAFEIKYKRARIMAKSNVNLDYNKNHPAESKAASGEHPNYTEMKSRIRKECDTYFKDQDERIKKIGRRV